LRGTGSLAAESCGGQQFPRSCWPKLQQLASSPSSLAKGAEGRLAFVSVSVRGVVAGTDSACFGISAGLLAHKLSNKAACSCADSLAADGCGCLGLPISCWPWAKLQVLPLSQYPLAKCLQSIVFTVLVCLSCCCVCFVRRASAKALPRRVVWHPRCESNSWKACSSLCTARPCDL